MQDEEPGSMSQNHILCVITGASRGFGRAFAINYAASIFTMRDTRITFVLVGRGKEALESLAITLTLSCSEVQAHIVDDVDLAQLDRLDQNLDRVFSVVENARKQQPFTKSILINNAGTLGQIDSVGECDWKEAKIHADVNVTSFYAFCSRFLKSVPPSPTNLRVIVNITSIHAIKPLPYHSQYSISKVARNQLLSVIALEEANNNTKTLSYSPGPLINDMTNELQDIIKNKWSDKMRETFGLHHVGQHELVDMNDSASKLAQILGNTDEWKSGAHIDYYQ